MLILSQGLAFVNINILWNNFPLKSIKICSKSQTVLFQNGALQLHNFNSLEIMKLFKVVDATFISFTVHLIGPLQ